MNNSNDFLNSLLSQMSSETLKSSKGLKKESVYKTAIFKDCTTSDDKKAIRRKLRNVIENFLKSFLACKDIASKEKFAKDFLLYYKEVYSDNSFTVSSLFSKNKDLNEAQTKAYESMLTFCKQKSETDKSAKK